MCIFCNIVDGKEKSWTIYKDKNVSAFFDYNPASIWHVLIVPNKHYKDIFEIPEEIIWEIAIVSKKIAIAYNKALGITEMNIIQSNWENAWQEVFHYHMHLVPRNAKDDIIFFWKPEVAIRNQFDSLKTLLEKELKFKK